MEINARLKQTIILKIALILISMFILSCTKQDYNPKLIEYLRAEKDLRNRISDKQILSDSINVLQKRYHIDPELELSKLKDNPDAWLKLVRELKIEK